MRTGYIGRLPNVQGGFFEVTRNPQGADFGPVDLTSPPKGVGHTTEGRSLPNYGSNAPQFTVGNGRIWQHRALGRMAGTLRNAPGGIETNRIVRVQYEFIGFSEQDPWLPDSQKDRDILASLYEFAEKECGIPEVRAWPDEEPGHPTIATLSYFRRQRRFPHKAGWYNHGEIPENTHWDMGDFKYRVLMALEPMPPMVSASSLVVAYRTEDGHRESVRLTGHFRDKGELRRKLVRDSKIRKDLWKALNGQVKRPDGTGKYTKVKRARPHVKTQKIAAGKVR